ncbi:hypothetical protein FB446DRAFT_634899 [Lentinula raphanica]|nr:hypothetical protein FB446DRAFT_634899 [Lentinula raphanica]
MGAGEHNVRVLLVPRLAFKFDADRDEFEETRSSRKRKRQSGKPEPVLFSLEKCRASSQELVTRIASDEALTDHDYKHKVLGTFSQGLLLKYFTPKSLSTATSIPRELYHLFVKSRHPFFKTAPILQPDDWEFLPGDKVTSSSHGREISGTVVSVTESGCEVECEEGLHSIPNLHLRKSFIPGDYVRILRGPEKDATGLVAAVTPRLVGLIPDHGTTVVCTAFVLLMHRDSLGSF